MPFMQRQFSIELIGFICSSVLIMSRETSAHSKSGWAQNYVVSFFDWSIFGKYGSRQERMRSRLVHWKCHVICKVYVGKNKSGMRLEFCVVDDWRGKNEALCHWSQQNKGRMICVCCWVRVIPIGQ